MQLYTQCRLYSIHYNLSPVQPLVVAEIALLKKSLAAPLTRDLYSQMKCLTVGLEVVTGEENSETVIHWEVEQLKEIFVK